MKSSSQKALQKELHPHAKQVVEEYVDKFSDSLTLQARMLAFQDDADLVLSNHVDEALRVISRERRKSRTREFLIIIGGLFVGAFISGFITELTAGRKLLVTVYTSLGFIGIILIFAGLKR